MFRIATIALAVAAMGITACEAKQGAAKQEAKVEAAKPAATPAAAVDTALTLKPTAEQLAAAKPATNKQCPVSKDAIGSMGDPEFVIYKGQSYALCCSGCKKKIAKDPSILAGEAQAGKNDVEAGHMEHAGHSAHH